MPETASLFAFGERRAHGVAYGVAKLNRRGEEETMPYILAFAFLLWCTIGERFTKENSGVLEPASHEHAAWKGTTGELVFGEHWQAWADTVKREAAEPSEGYGRVAHSLFPAA
jgi:hypothetical protein